MRGPNSSTDWQRGRLRACLLTILLAPFTPRRALRWWDGRGLPSALGIHSIGLLLLALGEVLLRDAAAVLPSLFDHDQVPSLLTVSLAQSWSDVAAVAAMAMGVGGGAAALVAVAALPWAWRDERFSATVAASFRTVGLLTTGLVLPYMLARVLVFAADYTLANRPWNDDFVATQEYFQCVAPIVDLLWPLWSLWVIWRGVTAQRVGCSVARDVTCEQCGYDLVHLSASERCPECGYPLASSLAPGHRRPCSWETEPGGLRIRALWACARDALRRPQRFFLELALDTHPGGAMRVFVIALGITGVLVWLSGWVVHLLVMPMRDRCTYLTFVFSIGVLLWSVAGAWSVAVAVLGSIVSRVYRRNVVGPVWRIAAYTAGWLVAWAIVAIGLYALAIAVYRLTGRFPAIGIVAFLVGNLVMLVGYIGIILRRVRYVRYVNFATETTAPVARGDVALSAAPPADP